MNKQRFYFTLFLLIGISIPSTTIAQLEISAVPSSANPAIGDTIELSINIAGASGVAGYDFTLTFDPTQLEFIGIENADFLPAGAFAPAPTVGNGSVAFAAAAFTGADKRNGTLATATFKVLTETETTIGFEDVEIGDQDAQSLAIASTTGATLNATPSTADPTTPAQVETPTVPTTEPPTTDDNTVSSTTPAQLEISAVPSVDNPAVDDQIEVSINIAGASGVAGYDFTLTFDPTKLEFISIENADFLPAGAFALEPTVANGSVKYAAAAFTGADKRNGTLAIGTFKVLVKTEATIRLEDVEIGDQDAQPLAIASITGATLNAAASTTDPTTEAQVETPTVPTTEPPATDDKTASSTTPAQLEISAVPSANNPAVGDQIEVSINIAGASGVAGYDFTLTFDPTKLEFIGIENADFLPAGAFALEPTVANGSVKYAAAAFTGADKRNGTLAIATFRVLTKTETTIGLEDAEIGNQLAQTVAVASVTGATINRAAPTAGADLEYLLSIPAGISLIHVPLRVTAIDGVARTITSIADLYNALGGASTVNSLITYDPQTQEWRSYFGAFDTGTPADKILTDDTGIIAGMIAPVSVRLSGSALGTNGNGSITLNPGPNVVGLPLRDSRVMRVSDLFALSGIGGNVPVIILVDGGEFKTVGRAGDPGDIEITGGQSFIMTAQRAATVIIRGDGWTNIK